MMKKMLYLVAVLLAGTAMTTIVSCSENDDRADYWLLKHIVDNKDVIAPIGNIDSSITDFFKTEWPTNHSYHGYFYGNFVWPSIWVDSQDTICDLINSQEQLQAIYKGDKTLPEIDFSNYTLLIGQLYSGDDKIQKVDLVQTTNGYVANIYVQDFVNHYNSILHLRFWRLYPKQASTEITINVIKSK